MADDEMVAWLTATLDGLVESSDDMSWPMRLDVVRAEWNDPECDDTLDVVGFSQRSVLARVQAERAVIALHPADLHGTARACVMCDQWLWEGGHTSPPGTPDRWPCHTLRFLAYGHRFDAPGYRTEWSPQ